jgi:hypothetical protein
VPDAVLRELSGPPVEGFKTAYPEFRRRDFSRSRVVRGDSEMWPVEEGDLYTVLKILNSMS